MTDCLECQGEGSHESEILCPGPGCSCDGFSGGCVAHTVCELCAGLGEVSYEVAFEWMQSRCDELERLLRRRAA